MNDQERIITAPDCHPKLVPLPDDRQDSTRRASIEALISANGYTNNIPWWKNFAKQILV